MSAPAGGAWATRSGAPPCPAHQDAPMAALRRPCSADGPHARPARQSWAAGAEESTISAPASVLHADTPARAALHAHAAPRRPLSADCTRLCPPPPRLEQGGPAAPAEESTISAPASAVWHSRSDAPSWAPHASAASSLDTGRALLRSRSADSTVLGPRRFRSGAPALAAPKEPIERPQRPRSPPGFRSLRDAKSEPRNAPRSGRCSSADWTSCGQRRQWSLLADTTGSSLSQSFTDARRNSDGLLGGALQKQSLPNLPMARRQAVREEMSALPSRRPAAKGSLESQAFGSRTRPGGRGFVGPPGVELQPTPARNRGPIRARHPERGLHTEPAASGACTVDGAVRIEARCCPGRTSRSPAAPQAADLLCRVQPSSSPSLASAANTPCRAPVLGHGDGTPAGSGAHGPWGAEAEVEELSGMLNSSLAKALRHMERLQEIRSDMAGRPPGGPRGRWGRS